MQPQYQPYPPQQQLAQPVQYAPQPQAPAPGWGGPQPQGPDQFGAPDEINIIRPRLKDAGPGRLLLISPLGIERKVVNRLGRPDANGQLPVQDRMTADVVFLDGPPFMFGGDPDGDGGPPRPHTTQALIPYESRSMWITNVLLIQQCERSVGSMVLGRLAKGESSKPGNRPPWKLTDPTEADRQIARQYLVDKQAGRIAPPAPQQAPPQQQQMQQQYPAQPYLAGQVQQYVPQQQSQAPALDIETPPTGMDPAIWAQLAPEQRAAIAMSAQSRPGI